MLTKLKLKCSIFILLLTCLHNLIYAQNVGINSSGAAPAASAGLDVNFTDKGLLIPRVTLTGTADVSTISSPATSLIVYNTATAGTSPNDVTPGYYYYTGSAWTRMANGNVTVTGWGTVGNSGTSAATNFVGTTDAVDMVFKASNTERLRLSSGGNVSFNGIGTGSSTDYLVSINNTTNIIKKIQPSSSSSPFWAIDGNAIATSAKKFGTTTAFDLPIITNNTERMRISSAGNIGIGTAPDVDIKVGILAGTNLYTGLSVVGDTDDYFEVNVQNTGNDVGGDSSTDIVATANDGSESSNYINMGINSSSYRAFVNGNARLLNGPHKAYIYSTGKEFYIGNSTGDEPLVFFTNSAADGDVDARGKERMRISGDDGEVHIGDITGNLTDLGNFILQVHGDANMDDITIDELTVATVNSNLNPDNDNAFSIGTNALRWKEVWAIDGTINTSDRRLKTNIKDLNYGLKEVMALQPVRYNWKTKPTTDNKIGLIAQDTKNIIPEVVYGDEKESLGMNYAELVPVLINAIKEQQKEIDELKKSNEAQQKAIDALLKK